MRVFYLFMAALLAAGFPADALTRTYFLPDYQSEFLYGNRVQDSDSGHHTSTPSCSDYGFYSAPQNNADCQRVSPPAPGLVCYSCTICSADYAYDSSNCSGDYVTSGSTCSGKYNQCICDRSKFPVSSGGCPSGQKIDTANSCKGPSDTETYYQCVDDSCYGVILKNACETQGRYCVPSSECPAGCEQCIDRCEGYKSYEGAIECDNGCMNASDQISGCSGLCQAGSTCKTTTCVLQQKSRDEAVWNGKGNTEAMLEQIGADALAATAANQFYVGDKNGDFGQGTWYLPSIGELMDVYGTDTGKITIGHGTSGATGENKKIINDALSTLASKGADAAALTNGYYWSSSETVSNFSWELDMGSGSRNGNNKDSNAYVRVFQLLENCFAPLILCSDGSAGEGAVRAPQIGDVMYADKTWGSADDYDGSKTAVGIVTEVGADGSVKIMNLKDLTFSSNNKVGNFNPDDPYGGSAKYMYHTTSAKYSEDVTDIPNYNSYVLYDALKSGGTT